MVGPNRLINIAVGDTLQERECSRSADFDLTEGGEVKQGDPFAGSLVLLSDPLEIGRLIPAPFALVSAGSLPWLVRVQSS